MRFQDLPASISFEDLMNTEIDETETTKDSEQMKDFTFDTDVETKTPPKSPALPPKTAREKKEEVESAYDHDAVTAIIQGVMVDTGTKMLTRAHQQRVADIFGMVLG